MKHKKEEGEIHTEKEFMRKNTGYFFLKFPPFLSGAGRAEHRRLSPAAVPLKPVSQTLDRRSVSEHG